MLCSNRDDVRDVTIPHEQTHSNRVCFQTWDVVFPNDLFSDYLEITTAVVVPCGGPEKSPVHRYCNSAKNGMTFAPISEMTFAPNKYRSGFKIR